MVKVPTGTFCMRGYVVMKISGIAVGCGISLMLLTACASTGGSSDQGRVPLRPLSCIAVLPAEAAFDKDVQWSAEQRRSLAEGAAFATEVTSRQLDGVALLVGRSHILQVDIVNAIGVLPQRFDRILAIAQLVADIQAEPDALVHLLDHFDAALGVREKLRHVGAVIVDGVLDVVLLNLGVDPFQELR